MDKNRDVRRVFSRQSGPNKMKPQLPITGNVEKEKSSRVKVKRSSVCNREMGFDGEDELHSTTTVSPVKFKLPRKIFSDSSMSVPRKLRSAIRKRSCEATSVPLPDAKRSNDRVNGVKSLRGDSLKKSKVNGWSDHLSRRPVPVSISKDEEEVAETLFALAGMIPLNGANDNNTDKSLEAKSSYLSRKQHSSLNPLSEVDPICQKKDQEATNAIPSTDSSAMESLKNGSLIDPEPPVWSKLSERRQLVSNLKASVPPVHFQIPPLLRACDDRQWTNSTFTCHLTEPNCESRLDETKPEKFQLPETASNFNIEIADLAASQNREHTISTECRNNASLTSRPLHGSGVGLPVQSSTMIFPSWLNNASYEDTFSAGKVPCSANGGRKSWRRCIAHVHISRLIQVLQTSEGKDTRPSDTSQLRSSGGVVANNGDDLNGTLAAGHMFGSVAHMSKTANDGLAVRNKCQVKEEEGPSVSGFCDSKTQNYNFLSLSTGAGPEVNNDVNRLGITLEAKGHKHQLHSAAQRNAYMSCSMPQNGFPPIPYRDQLGAVSMALPSVSPQVHLQVPPYFGNPCRPAHIGTGRSTQQPHPKHQQQQIWTAQLAAQFRPGPLLSSHTANWQNSTRDPQSVNHAQVHLSAPRPSLEPIGSKYLQISQQQQQFFAHCPPLPASSVKLQNSSLPSICEDKGGRFHPDGVLPLQLLCNERL